MTVNSTLKLKTKHSDVTTEHSEIVMDCHTNQISLYELTSKARAQGIYVSCISKARLDASTDFARETQVLAANAEVRAWCDKGGHSWNSTAANVLFERCIPCALNAQTTGAEYAHSQFSQADRYFEMICDKNHRYIVERPKGNNVITTHCPTCTLIAQLPSHIHLDCKIAHHSDNLLRFHCDLCSRDYYARSKSAKKHLRCPHGDNLHVRTLIAVERTYEERFDDWVPGVPFAAINAKKKVAIIHLGLIQTEEYDRCVAWASEHDYFVISIPKNLKETKQIILQLAIARGVKPQTCGKREVRLARRCQDAHGNLIRSRKVDTVSNTVSSTVSSTVSNTVSTTKTIAASTKSTASVTSPCTTSASTFVSKNPFSKYCPQNMKAADLVAQ